MTRSDNDDDDEIGVTTSATTTVPTTTPDGAVIAVVSGSDKGRTLRLPGKQGASVTIGSARGNDLVLSHHSVSRRHLRVRRVSSGLEVADLESTNGTFVGPVRVREALVEPGSILRAGDVQLMIAVEVDRNVVMPTSPNDRFGLALGSSLEMRRIFGVLERMAPTQSSIVMWGETGTGKDVLARSVHLASNRADGPFEVVDCGAVSSSLIESELFGHERGAFTGAVAARAGAFERAMGGTVFLDEIGELALELQPKLLRVLEAREFRRLGGNKTIAADVRVIAATTRDLQRAAAEGTFREDLYFRLAVISIHVPPLRERREDIPLLVERLLTAAGSKLDVAPEVLAMLRAYEWPGNIRELRNVIERGVHFSVASGLRALKLVDFPPRRSSTESVSATNVSYDENLTYSEARAAHDGAFEKSYVSWLLDRFDGNVAAAARGVRMDRNHLTDLARRHGLLRRRT
jgi:transcriptional regulator with GAF, ATPase, and Fis domain